MNNNITMIDIMSNRKNNSDLCWILKDYEGKVPYFNSYKSSELVKKHLLNSKKFKYDIQLLSDKTGKTIEQLMKEALSILNGMCHNIGMNSIRLMGFTLSKIIKQMYQKVYVNAVQIEKLRAIFCDSNVILLPTHRSYADFLLMSYVMFQFNLPMPVIAAAMDFMNMKLIGELLRGCGAFFIRRRFAKNETYWNVFSHYIKCLIELKQEPLEFFIEGTRSRTNKSLFPRIGLLGIVLELWLSKGLDIELVPISISYDRILEERLYAWELLGVPKPKESTSGLLKVRHILNDDYGSIYFNVSNPISISALAARFGITRRHHNLELKWKPNLFDREKSLLRYLGNLIVANQQLSMLISDWSIVGFVLVYENVLTESRLISLVDALSELLASWGVQLASRSDESMAVGQSSLRLDTRQRIQSCLNLHRDLCRSVDGTIDASSNVATSIDEKIAHQIQLGNARNPLLVFLARESVLLSRLRHGHDTADYSDVARDYQRVMDLLSREFIYCLGSDGGGEGCPTDGQAEMTTKFDSTINRLLMANLVTKSADQSLQPNLDHPCYLLVESAVHMHLLVYAICAHLLINNDIKYSSSPICQQTPTEQCKSIQNCIKDICVNNPKFETQNFEMCSLDIIKNAVTSLSEIMKSCHPMDIREVIGMINLCLPEETKRQLSRKYSNMFPTP